MPADDVYQPHEDFSDRLTRRLGFGRRQRLTRVLALLLLTWAPLAVLSWWAGCLISGRVALPFLPDLEVHARFLVVVPLLELSRYVVSVGLRTQTRHFIEMGIVPEREQKRFYAARDRAIALRDSWWTEVILLIVSWGLALTARVVLQFHAGDNSWEYADGARTAAGWCYTLVSLPILYFALLHWVWVFIIWSWFLFEVSRLDLELTPTHPDHTGGLGFVGWGLASFSSVVLAISTVMAAAFADEILHRGASLDDLKYHVVVYVVVALLIIHAPLFAFAGKLLRCRFAGLLDFGAMAWRHDRAFEEKWLQKTDEPTTERLLGSSDLQTLASVGVCYEHVEKMWPIPFDVKAFAVLILAAILPMLPLLGTAIPLKEIFLKLGELLI